MSFLKVWIHLVWTTKNRAPMLSDRETRLKILSHIRENAKEKNILIDTVNAVDDHIHVLIKLKPEDNIAQIVKLIKGESAFWINKQQLMPWKFEWQNDYYAVSLGPDHVNKLRLYIYNQEGHHNLFQTTQEEIDEIIRLNTDPVQ